MISITSKFILRCVIDSYQMLSEWPLVPATAINAMLGGGETKHAASSIG